MAHSPDDQLLDPSDPAAVPMTWIGILRLGLVQTSLAAIIVLMTATINRVMIVEVGLPAFVPGLLVAGHYAVQILRPAWGYGSDRGGRRTPWIRAGMAMLAIGGTGAAIATALMTSHLVIGLLIAAASFLVLGIGAGAAGTSVLAMLATNVARERRPAAATIVWVMMIFGFALTAPIAGHFLDPYTPTRLILVTAGVALLALLISSTAIWGLERPRAAAPRPLPKVDTDFASALRDVWRDPAARRLTLFIFVSMFAYSAEELVLEPFAGVVFAMTPGASTKLSGVQHGGVLLGMLALGGLATIFGRSRISRPRVWTIAGCFASALGLMAIATGGLAGPAFPLRGAVFCLGFANGVFAVSAIAMMMDLAGRQHGAGAGTRMGVWGAAQAVAFAIGGFIGTSSVDVARHFMDAPAAYGMVFVGEGLLFLISAALALRLTRAAAPSNNLSRQPFQLALERHRL